MVNVDRQMDRQMDRRMNKRTETCTPKSPKLKKVQQKWTNKGNSKHQEADSLLHNATRHTQHLYQISKSWVQLFLRNLWHKFPYVLHWSERWKRRQKLISASWFSFPQYTWPLSRCIQNLKTGSHRSQEICNRNLYWRERKMDKI